jgi:hypothetical protein
MKTSFTGKSLLAMVLLLACTACTGSQNLAALDAAKSSSGPYVKIDTVEEYYATSAKNDPTLHYDLAPGIYDMFNINNVSGGN